VPELEMLEMDLPEEQEVDQQRIVERKLELAADQLVSSPQALLGHAKMSSKGQRLADKKPTGSLRKDLSFVVEDTGFYLDCLSRPGQSSVGTDLPGLPGPLIKWFLQTIGRKGIYEICKKFDNYKARGLTIIGYRDEKGEKKFFKGEVKGKVVLDRGFEGGTRNGFGWDPVFVPDGEGRTFAEMSREQKNEISMRRKAFEQLAREIAK